MMEYRLLTPAELVPELFLNFRRYQEITRCWCKTDGNWEVRPEPRTIPNWEQSQREFVCEILQSILSEGGMATGAFENGALKGFLAVEGLPMGSRNQYLAIPFLHVSQELRGQGVGRRLFAMAKEFAAGKGVEKLYLSSNPAVETQAFYKAMGCTEAEESSAIHVAHNPKECQLECKV